MRPCALLHPQSVHLARELVAELLEEILAQQLVRERAEHACFDLVAADGQVVVATTLVAGAEASEAVLRRHDESGTAGERLMNLLTALDHDVEIVIRQNPAPERPRGSASSPLEPPIQATSISRYGRITRSRRSAFATRSSSFRSRRRLLRASMRASIATSRPILFRNRKQSTTVRATL